jgi:hypothetical protein
VKHSFFIEKQNLRQNMNSKCEAFVFQGKNETFIEIRTQSVKRSFFREKNETFVEILSKSKKPFKIELWSRHEELSWRWRLGGSFHGDALDRHRSYG